MGLRQDALARFFFRCWSPDLALAMHRVQQRERTGALSLSLYRREWKGRE